MSALNLDMSSDSPIDINMNKIRKDSGTPKDDNICVEKCSYSYKYPSANTFTAVNNGDYISLKVDITSTVEYNGKNDYQVSEIRIYFPSIHTYNNGAKGAGEFIIIHTSISGRNNLIVCIPIQVNDSSINESTVMFKNLVNGLKVQAPAIGDTATIKSSIKLNSIVPYKPFFSYSGTPPFSSSPADFVVFSINEYTLYIGSNEYNTLTPSIIKQHNFTVKRGGELYYNPNGPNVTKDNQIYIKCQPAGSSEKKKVIKRTGTNISIETLFKKDSVWLMFNCLLFIVIIYGMYFLLKMNNSSKPFWDALEETWTNVLNTVGEALDMKLPVPSQKLA